MDIPPGDAASHPDAKPEGSEEPALLVIDASGVDGRDGRDGTTFAGSVAQHGYHGRPGGDAGEAQPGERAGEIELVLRADNRSPGVVELEGRRAIPGRRLELVRERVVISDRGRVRLLACGGQGGHGGRGGDGEAGGRGIDGVDATQWSSGGDGSAGGRGGDGGNGTSGAAGGDGGLITVQVDALDTDLLMLIEARADSGAGGQPGANGAGGEGGPGGAGGAGHSWTTSSTEYRTDAQGRPQPHTVHQHHHNPGGHDGPRGARGRDGAARLQPGRSGAPGHVHLLVQDGTHVTQYAERYELEITGYDLQLEDDCAEPTSRLVISNVTVRNSGGMPTPLAQPPQVLLGGGPWVEPQAQRLQLPVSLEPGASYSFAQETLTARVPELDDVPVGDPLRVTVHIDPLAVQSRVNRPYANQHPRQEFTVAFPAELAAVQSLESQTPGRAALLLVDVQNRSRHDLGAASAGQRSVGVRIQLANAELAPHLMLLDLQGQQVPWDTGYHTDIPLLAAQQTATVRTILGVLPGAPGYTRAEVFVTLELGQRHTPHQPRDRHRRDFPVRIARAYEFDPTTDILLITHHSTTPEELQAWEQAAATVGQKINVWDISLNDSLSLSEQLAHGQNLLRDLHGKTIILSNAPFQTALGTRYADQFLSQMDLIKAAASHDIRLLIVNDGQRDLNHLFHERLIPTDGEPEYRYGSVKSFLKSEPLEDVDVLFDQVDELVRHGAKAARPDPLRQTSDIDIYGVRSPSARRLRRQAADLQRRLQHRAPGRRVVVTYRLPSERTPAEQQARREEEPRSGIFFTHEYQGTLTVMPTLGDHHPNLVAISADAATLHQPAFVTGTGVRSALLQALRFEEKVYLLSDKLRVLGESARIDPQSLEADDVAAAQSLVDAILIDLAAEQAAVLQTGWQPLFFGDTLRQSLVQLRFLADHPFPLVTGERQQADVQLAARLVAGVEFLGTHAARWYDSRWWPWGWFRRGPVVSDEFQRQARQLANNLFRTASPAQQRAWQEARESYATQLQTVRRRQRGVGRCQAAREVVQTPLAAAGVRTDAGRTFPGVLAYRDWDAVRQAETQREAARVALKEEKERQRTEFTVVRGGRAVPGLEPDVVAAVEPFVAACRTAYAEQDRHNQEVLRQRAAERAETGPRTDVSSAPPRTPVQETH